MRQVLAILIPICLYTIYNNAFNILLSNNLLYAEIYAYEILMDAEIHIVLFWLLSYRLY
jgi:hypothetical protein